MHGDEPMKWAIAPKAIGWRGNALADHLRQKNIEVEFADPDFVVMMFTPEVALAEIQRLTKLLCSLPRRTPVAEMPPALQRPVQRMSAREALFSPQERLPVEEALGHVLAAANVTCPPAVPIVVCGEEIDESAIACLRYYGIETCTVVRK